VEDGFDKTALHRAVSNIYLEVFPSECIHEQLLSLPGSAYVGITCSPSKGIEATLALVERLNGHALNLVPHIAARQVRDVRHLRDILAELEGHGIKSLFVPGGDMRRPAGQFDSALSLLRMMAEIGHGMTDIGVAAHPEGHPLIDDETMLVALQDKQEFANYFVTQMCFDSGRLIEWLTDIRQQGIKLQAWIGLPGVINRRQLLATSLRIGVGESAKFALKQKALAGKLLTSKRYRPDDLLFELAPYLEIEPLNIGGFYMFSFNQIEDALSWRAEMMERLV
jgi:methylenetetrahydrofolate reductase (NADPH)